MTLSLFIINKIVNSTRHQKCKSALCFTLSDRLINFVAYFCTTSKDEKKEIKLPQEPQNCCMSGCANCVWITYAEELAKILNDEGITAKQKIIEHVKDPNLRAFIMLELSHLFKKEK